MNTNGLNYATAGSDARIHEILDASDQGYEEVDTIPSVNRLTYTNGFYVNRCTAIFIDIRGSSQLAQSHTRPVLGKLYRAYLSECVAILNQDPNCKQIFINGDCVSGMFDGNLAADVDSAVYRVGQLNAMLNILNWRLAQRGYQTIQCGMGIDYGRALMLKAGFSGSGINDVIWLGDVVNNASNLCHQGNKNGLKPIQISTAVYNKASRQDYKALMVAITGGLFGVVGYQGNFVSMEMSNWLETELASSRMSGLGRGIALISGGIGQISGGIGTNALGGLGQLITQMHEMNRPRSTPSDIAKLLYPDQK